jgi:predicted amidophosphoribosyltransferase
MQPMTCGNCGGEIPVSMERCPHCALPGIFPNVRAAEDGAEQAELERRYQDALQSATARNCLSELLTFQAAAAQATAVVARPLGEVQRLATSDKQGYATHSYNVTLEVR